MARPSKLDPAEVDRWLAAHGGWQRVGDTLERTYRFANFAGALAFAVRLGMVAEKRDHHPDVTIGWGRAHVLWTTHDAGGITALDLELAAVTDGLATSA